MSVLHALGATRSGCYVEQVFPENYAVHKRVCVHARFVWGNGQRDCCVLSANTILYARIGNLFRNVRVICMRVCVWVTDGRLHASAQM